jgi:predicted RNA-binding Zn-ribbon protein involved in translation (DUF1610 family)
LYRKCADNTEREELIMAPKCPDCGGEMHETRVADLISAGERRYIRTFRKRKDFEIEKVKQEKVWLCPLCGRWHPLDFEEREKGEEKPRSRRRTRGRSN